MKKLEVDVHHITRVEGHGNIKVRMNDGVIDELKLEIVESPRFFESMLIGRFVDEVPHITSRICGICAVGHTTAACRAGEKALGFTPPEEVNALRRLMLDAEFIQSHILHEYFLVAPDFFGVGSVIPLAEKEPDVVRRALRLKKLGNTICEILAGRHVHPVAMAVGGFTRWPAPSDFRKVKSMLEESRADMEETVRLFEKFEMPPLQRPTEYIALRSESDRYELLEGTVTSSEGESVHEEAYLDLISESSVEHSSARHVRTARGTFAVGALARYMVNHDRLSAEAKRAAHRLALSPETVNPFHNNAAQIVESVHCVDEGIALCDELLRVKNPPVFRPVPGRAGSGTAAVEVPRGTLYHHYRTDRMGRIEGADCIIPTGQNQANIEEDLHQLVSDLAAEKKSEDEIRQGCEMLVRAYDPCISCSAHFLEVEFVR